MQIYRVSCQYLRSAAVHTHRTSQNASEQQLIPVNEQGRPTCLAPGAKTQALGVTLTWAFETFWVLTGAVTVPAKEKAWGISFVYFQARSAQATESQSNVPASLHVSAVPKSSARCRFGQLGALSSERQRLKISISGAEGRQGIPEPI